MRSPEGIFKIMGTKYRAKISVNKIPMLEAARQAIALREEFWPLSVREIHYCLLSDPPLRHAKKPESKYANDKSSYNDLCDLLLRARVQGLLAWDMIADETRPVVSWQVYRRVSEYVQEELEGLFGTYSRDLLQSQPNHHEIIIEKNTSLSVIERVAEEYTITATSERGQTCKVRLREITQRFKYSKKEKLVVYILSDFDPSGDLIANSNVLSLRDDMKVEEDRIVPVRVAIRFDQIEQYSLKQSLEIKEAKTKSHKTINERFMSRHGVNYAVELEALAPEHLQRELDRAIRSMIDVDAYNREIELEKTEAASLKGIRDHLLRAMQNYKVQTI